jgi:hypothetical protein
MATPDGARLVARGRINRWWQWRMLRAPRLPSRIEVVDGGMAAWYDRRASSGALGTSAGHKDPRHRAKVTGYLYRDCANWHG